MVDISFRPIRLYKISFLPASVSKYHELPLLTSSTGVGQFFAPIYKVVAPSGSLTRRCISRYFCTKLARLWASSVSSPEETICLPSGPRISSIALSSLLCTAVTSALLAASGDENVFWPSCCAMEKVEKHPVKRTAIAANLGLAQWNLLIFSFVRCIWLLSPPLSFTICYEHNETSITDARHRHRGIPRRHHRHEILRRQIRPRHAARRHRSWRFRAMNSSWPLRHGRSR